MLDRTERAMSYLNDAFCRQRADVGVAEPRLRKDSFSVFA